MSDPNQLSKPYCTRDEAAVGGFRRVLMNSVEWETKEYAFFVILKLNEKKEIKYHYTTPQTDGSSHGVKLTIPNGLMVRAFCHKKYSRGLPSFKWQVKAFQSLHIVRQLQSI